MNGALRCTSCHTEYGDRSTLYRCSSCGHALSFTLESPAFPREKIQKRPPDVWRYAEAIPAFAERVSLGEPITPLLPFKLGELEILAKCEFTHPTGSYKDRAAAFLVSYLRSAGVSEAVEDSSGNAGASLAAYAARAGIHLKVFCPATAAAGKLVQIRLYGAELVPIPGPRARATEALLDYVEKTGTVYASHLWNPFFIEGVKTMAFEICEQLGWKAPDMVFCPVGAGSIPLGLHKGFGELLEASVISRLPRLIAVQALNVSPVYQAFKTNADRIEPFADPRPTLAEGIALPVPVRDQEVLQALRQSCGTVVAVSEEDIATGVKLFGRAGFCVEPTSAVVWKAVEHLHAQEPISPDASVVVVLSGHGLKATRPIDEMMD